MARGSTHLARRARRARRFVDAALGVLVWLQMLQQAMPGHVHEACGVLLAAVLVAHIVQHRRWFAALARGRWDAWRVLRTAVIAAALAALSASVVSGLAMSTASSTLGLGGTATARAVHLPASHLAFCLLALHAGLQTASLRPTGAVRPGGGHSDGPARPGEGKRRPARAATCAVLAAAGIWAFIDLRFPAYLSGAAGFAFMDAAKPVAFLALEYLLVAGLFFILGAILAQAAKSSRRR